MVRSFPSECARNSTMSSRTRPSSRTPPRTPSDCAIRSVLTIASRSCGMDLCRRSMSPSIMASQSPLTLSMISTFSGLSVMLHSSPTPQNDSSGSEMSSRRSSRVSSRRAYIFCITASLRLYFVAPTFSRMTLAISRPIACSRGLRMSRNSSRIASFCIPVTWTDFSTSSTSGRPFPSPTLMFVKLSTTIVFTMPQSRLVENPLATSISVAVATSCTSGFTMNSSAGHEFLSAYEHRCSAGMILKPSIDELKPSMRPPLTIMAKATKATIRHTALFRSGSDSS
mmetsp:Transcript_116433/g.329948  ORF Transcript_116433/g.329948 Transcript_116433/m.329948 type:complete len:283 (+) Transcript_116433:255-1103(+)